MGLGLGEEWGKRGRKILQLASYSCGIRRVREWEELMAPRRRGMTDRSRDLMMGSLLSREAVEWGRGRRRRPQREEIGKVAVTQ